MQALPEGSIYSTRLTHITEDLAVRLPPNVWYTHLLVCRYWNPWPAYGTSLTPKTVAHAKGIGGHPSRARPFSLPLAGPLKYYLHTGVAGGWSTVSMPAGAVW